MLQTPERLLGGTASLSKSGAYEGVDDATSSANTDEETEPSWLLLLLAARFLSRKSFLDNGEEDQTTANPMATANPTPQTAGNQRLETRAVLLFHAGSSVPVVVGGTSCQGLVCAGETVGTVGSHVMVVGAKKVVGIGVGESLVATNGIPVVVVIIILVGDAVGAKVGGASVMCTVGVTVGDAAGSGYTGPLRGSRQYKSAVG